ncbi:sigma 54-interacting transcriptional regulator [Myxococcus sp. RHSTA-1-4]|uniref:sigma 54-interacting transcriptional regulator n=1 Tax=Myxococcus sp. RHSTA-1-4 TaxID=2874601 RepID=UPI001CBB0A1E|nr:sigma 54-interacting transcriptional regulator [Myxococcus sp. RHSTA-1-4]MBZ4420670.1 sigma 54-interacting transcriptional regulator [Myxococcus sp. RHSTA-1-4]
MEPEQSTLRPSGVQGGSDSGAPRVPGLLRLFGAGATMAVALPLGGEALELGRGAAVLGEAQDPRMSRRHARVHFDGRRFFVTDLGSQNGTFVEGEPVPAGTPREAQRVIRMGDSLFVPCADVGPLQRHGVALVEGFVRGPALQRLLEEVARAAQLGFSLHIHGESGTGKEGVARAFHQQGPRRDGPFVAVNCAAIPHGLAERLLFGVKRGAYSGADADAQGYLQAADGGTLFLDEVVELDLAVQAKLLRALEMREVLALGAAKPKPVDLHLCSASNRELRAQVASGRLREDLYFRLGRPEVTLPPLRQRPEELPLLLQREVLKVAPALGLHVSLVEACLLRPWPGNVRELLVEARGAVQAALLQGAARVEARHLSPSAGTAFGPALSPEPPAGGREVVREAPRARPLDAGERTRLEEALRRHGGNVAATARALDMHRTQLRRLLKRHGLSPGTEGEGGEE